MFKLNITHTNSYNEIPQSNPIRWRIMYKSKDTLNSQSGLLKCKDFFNDVVAYKNSKKEFSIYNFSNKVKFNREGLYVHLTEIANCEMFCNNLAVVNARLYKDLKTFLNYECLEDGSVVVCIPHKLWRTTYYISLVTMAIRLCNYKMAYDSWESMFDKKAPAITTESAFTQQAIKYVTKKGFRIPVKLRKMWFWAGDKYHSGNQEKPMASVIHNNGVSSWVQFLGAK